MYIDNSYMFITMISAIISYVISIYPLYYTFKEANLKNRWMAFIPILGSLKMFNLANIKTWQIVVLYISLFIPFINIITCIIYLILCFIMNWRVSKNFGLGTVGCVVSLFFGFITMWYITLTHKKFIGELDDSLLDK